MLQTISSAGARAIDPPRRLRPWLRAALVCLACALIPALPGAADRPGFNIEPGPTTMTAEERALLPDPAAGAQHAIVLVDDTVRDDTMPRTGRHLRVKVLSGRWRGIGDIEIPYEAKSLIEKWWTNIIPPEGPAIEIGKDGLVPQVAARRGGARYRVLKIALPRVEAGSVIDLGYVIHAGGSEFERLNLQQPWPVKHLRYFWAPLQTVPSQYHVLRRPGIPINVSRGKDSILLEATDVPAFADEPWSPPDDLIRASAVFHYTFDQPNADPNVFWDEVARDREQDIAEFLKDDTALKQIMKGLDLSGADLQDRLRSAYDWIERNVRNTDNLTSEEDEQRDAERELQVEKERRAAYTYHRRPGTLKDILEHHEASANALDRLFLAIARALGAQAHLVLATDREHEYWDRTLYSRYQFSSSLVAVRAPGEPLDKAVFVDPGWGLPYGVVDWRVTATRALVVTPQAAREVTIPHQRAEANGSQTRARISFDPASGEGGVTWSATYSGQAGREERASVRAALPDERDRELRRICGEGAAMEVYSADLPGWQEAAGAIRLQCGGDLSEPGPGARQSVFSLRFAGPWVPAPPVPLSPVRTHPIVFPYPRDDRTEIELSAPAGFTASAPPAAASLASSFGRYSLTVTESAGGFRIDRRLSLTAITVRPEQYAELRRFLQDVRRADATPLWFHRKETGS